jgi:hypothetical protein
MYSQSTHSPGSRAGLYLRGCGRHDHRHGATTPQADRRQRMAASQDSSLDEHIPKDLDGVVWMLAYIVAGLAEAASRGTLDKDIAQGLGPASTILSRTASKLNHPEIARMFGAASTGFARSAG